MNNIDHSTDAICFKVNIPDKGIFEKTFTFNHDEKVWAAKERVIHEVGKESKDIQNYGFFMPPCHGKAGKFMDEGRPLSEYSLPDDEQSLEFMLKRRIYRSISFNENKLTKIHTKANLKKLMELVEQNNAGQVNQFLEKGLDPNFQDAKTGETPLTAVMANATEVIMFLVNGGAHLDFRNRDGVTAVHKAAAMGNGHNIKAFLDLGASPNYRDLKGLTPLYHACLHGGNSYVAELLLSEQAEIAIVDSQGWQEIHQVCRYGHIQHLEQLIFYSADLNAQNGSGNTPLHICALYNQEECAKLLLYRGARRDIVNFANQTAEVVAVVATNTKLSEFIKNYNEKDVVPYIDKPMYSTRRRTQSKTRPTANSVFLRDSTDTFIFCSETLSTTSSTSETSEPMSLDLSPREVTPEIPVPEKKSPSRKYKRARTMSGSGTDSSYATDSGDETGGSAITSPVSSPTNEDLTLRWRTYSLSSLNKEERGTVPRVKEVKGAANMTLTTGKNHSRKVYVAVKDFIPTQPGELSLAEGNLVEVVTKGDKGYWQGSVHGNTGWFPAECVDQLKKIKSKSKNALHKPPSVASSLNKSNTSLDQPCTPVITAPQTRQVILQKVKTGFGFQMRGANATANKLEFQLSPKIPALQYIGDVEPGGEAEKQGVKKGDYILEINGTDIRTATHRNVVSLIRKTGQNLIMKIISIENGKHATKQNNTAPNTMPSGIAQSNNHSEVPGERVPPVVNGTGGNIDGTRNHKEKKPPVPSRASTTSLTRPKSFRQSVADVEFEKPQSIQEDRVISVPRERISPTDNQWQSPLSGHQSLPRRPKSSYGAIIGSTHDASTRGNTTKNYHAVESLDNTGFMTLPSKADHQVYAPRFVSQDDSLINQRKTGSRRSKDRPKSWMPKVLPTALPTTPPGSPPVQQSPNIVTRNEQKGGEFKKDKKRRFSFKKKKEKDYTVDAPSEPPEELGAENNVLGDDVTENLHIEDEQNRPSSLPVLHKRLSTFKPVTVHNRHMFKNEAVSPELTQALEKRKSRALSDSTNEMSPPLSPQGHNPPVFAPPHRPKSLQESINEEMMRRRSSSESASSIPMKPRRTFEYKKPHEDPHGEQDGDLDAELAKAIAKRAAKLTSEPAKEVPIYENINSLNNPNQAAEPKTMVEEPPVSNIDEKLKTHHFQEEVHFTTKFKPPVQPPVGKKPANGLPSGKPPASFVPPESTSHGKAPPKTLPKPKRKPSSSTSDELPKTPRPVMALPLSTELQITLLPPPILSPEMVATQFLDDVIDEEVKRCNWDTASWLDKASPKSSVSSNDGSTPPLHGVPNTPPHDMPITSSQVLPATSPQPATSSSGKKKYIYKVTLVTEKPSDGPPVEHAPIVTQFVSSESSTKSNASPNDSPLPPPPLEFNDKSPVSFPPPIFTPPSSPPPALSNDIPPPLSQELLLPLPQGLPPPLPQEPPPPLPQEPPPPLPQEPPPPLPQEPLLPQELPPPLPQEPPPPLPQEPPPPLPQEPPPPLPQEPPPPLPQEPPPITQKTPAPQESPPSIPPEPVPHVSSPGIDEPSPAEESSKLAFASPLPPPVIQPQTEVVDSEVGVHEVDGTTVNQPKEEERENEPSPPEEESSKLPFASPLPPPVIQPHTEVVDREVTTVNQPKEEDRENEPSPPEELSKLPFASPLPPPMIQPHTEVVDREVGVHEVDGTTVNQPKVYKEEERENEPSPLEELSKLPFASPLPPPVIQPHTEVVDREVGVHEIDGPTINQPKEEEKENKVSIDIVVPPPVFADSGNDVTVPTAEASTTHEKQSNMSEEVEACRPCPEKTESVVETTSDIDTPETDVSAPAGVTDHNENVVKPPTMYSGGATEELAPSKPVMSEVSTNSTSFRDIPYEIWSCVHVCQWLDSIAMVEHQELFQENDIRGQNLLGLTKDDLRELGVKKLGHRMTITDEIHTLTVNRGSVTNL